MKWGTYKLDGDTVHGIGRHAADLYKWEIRVVGTDSCENPTRWGVWCDGVPFMGKPSRAGTHQVTFDRVGAAKVFVEHMIVESLP